MNYKQIILFAKVLVMGLNMRYNEIGERSEQ